MPIAPLLPEQGNYSGFETMTPYGLGVMAQPGGGVFEISPGITIRDTTGVGAPGGFGGGFGGAGEPGIGPGFNNRMGLANLRGLSNIGSLTDFLGTDFLAAHPNFLANHPNAPGYFRRFGALPPGLMHNLSQRGLLPQIAGLQPGGGVQPPGTMLPSGLPSQGWVVPPGQTANIPGLPYPVGVASGSTPMMPPGGIGAIAPAPAGISNQKMAAAGGADLSGLAAAARAAGARVGARVQ
jgi:hypothetical protein